MSAQAPKNTPAHEHTAFYRRGLLLTDLAILGAIAGVAQFWHFGIGSNAKAGSPFDVSYSAVGAVLVVMWWGALQLLQTRDVRVIGVGPDEYRRVARATFLMFGWAAIVSLTFKWEMSRGYLAIAFPMGLASLLIGRKCWRLWLRQRRLKGDLLSNVLVVGGVRSAQEIANWLNQHRAFGLNVTGVWIPDEDTRPDLAIKVPGQLIPVVGNDLDLAEALVLSRADTVIVSDTEHLGHHGLRDLTWQLEDLDIDLMVSPNVADFSGSRIHVRFVAGMPFMHLEQPQYAEAGSWPKLLFDRVFAVVAIIAFSPAIVVAALAVKIDTRGPLLYRQRRVGRDGREFDLLKFRSMHKDADKQLAALVAAQGTGDTPLFKVKDDPRITRVGAFLRRYSIDELPQLFNVLQGEMSLVGPRPQVAEEVKLYDYRAFRRLAVRPGMTGLWQVSGRSDLSWEDAIRLDLYYVENWSLTTDLVILAKTLRAVIGSSGAY